MQAFLSLQGIYGLSRKKETCSSFGLFMCKVKVPLNEWMLYAAVHRYHMKSSQSHNYCSSMLPWKQKSIYLHYPGSATISKEKSRRRPLASRVASSNVAEFPGMLEYVTSERKECFLRAREWTRSKSHITPVGVSHFAGCPSAC